MLNPDGSPNSDCILSSDSLTIRKSNKFGVIFIDEKYKGESITLIDIISDWDTQFLLNNDTVITVEKIHQFDDVEIKPFDTKELYKEILTFNQEKLPKKLNLMGEVFFAEMYIMPKSKSNHQMDSLIEMFSCDAIILDVFGARQIFIKNPKKYRIGEIENKEYLELIKPLMVPFKRFEKSIGNQLAYKSYEIKRLKKFNSRYLIDDNSKSLMFSKDFSSMGGFEGGTEYNLSWNKNDSLFNKLSRYSEMGSKNSDNAAISFPFASSELSNIDNEYIGTSVLNEVEIEFTFSEERLVFTNSNFGYFYIHKKVRDDINQDDYIEIDNFETLYQTTIMNQSADKLTPIIYPLRFPSTIFFD